MRPSAIEEILKSISAALEGRKIRGQTLCGAHTRKRSSSGMQIERPSRLPLMRSSLFRAEQCNLCRDVLSKIIKGLREHNTRRINKESLSPPPPLHPLRLILIRGGIVEALSGHLDVLRQNGLIMQLFGVPPGRALRQKVRENLSDSSYISYVYTGWGRNR